MERLAPFSNSENGFLNIYGREFSFSNSETNSWLIFDTFSELLVHISLIIHSLVAESFEARLFDGCFCVLWSPKSI